jgi:hypothetical protein
MFCLLCWTLVNTTVLISVAPHISFTYGALLMNTPSCTLFHPVRVTYCPLPLPARFLLLANSLLPAGRLVGCSSNCRMFRAKLGQQDVAVCVINHSATSLEQVRCHVTSALK